MTGEQSARITVRVQPNAKRNEVVRLEEDGILSKTGGYGQGGAYEIFQRNRDLNGTLAYLNEKSWFLFVDLMDLIL